ncbi:HEAT repeat-containing protein 4-like isoform X2 [Dreissena polymorpha]|uniref:HEAT repeat-containing protein 4-like isoform X2 n=1 Tax=Dreissena polymorpha TaxID=45954 RepID=UPI002263B17A|nr:HEAT repeat-containing protein 4-like isoform X2 [Dreissena polymorpha]
MSASTAERLKTPLLFPCAAGVKMPQIGSEDSDLKLGQKTSRYAPDAIVFRTTDDSKDPINKEYLKKVSFDLNFEEEVVKERCFHALPYDEKYMYEAFDVGDLVKLPIKTKFPVGRHNARGGDNRHMPCYLTKSTKSHLKPLRRKITERAQQMHIEALKREQLREIQQRIIEKHRALERGEPIAEDTIKESLEEEQEPREGGFFLTETKPSKTSRVELDKADKPSKTAEDKAKDKKSLSVPRPSIGRSSASKSHSRTAAEIQAEDEDKKEKKKSQGNNWDAYVISLLSMNTANHLVYEKTAPGTAMREKLENMVKEWYGVPEHTDLIREEISDSEEEEEKAKIPKKKWRKKETTLLQRVYNLEEDEPRAVDPYSDDNKAPFYRQPAGLRRAKKHEVKEELGAINTTAANIEVKTLKPPPPPTLRDFLNPNVGKCIIETDNMFQQEQLTGTQQVYQAFADQEKIVMENDNKYKKDLQPGFPKPPETWFPATDAEKESSAVGMKKTRKHIRGHRRWKNLPESIDDTAEILRVQAPGTEPQKSSDPRYRKTAKNNASLIQITADVKGLDFTDRSSPVRGYTPAELLRKLQAEKRSTGFSNDPKLILDEWRSKWHLAGQYVDSTPDDLIRDMADIQPHVRLKAIVICAKAADYKPPEDHGIQLNFMEKESAVDLPEKLFVALECLLEDPVEKVKTAAAITLYSLNRPCKMAEDILNTAMGSENPVDRWAAAQCLAHYGVCDSDVISEILRQVMTTEDTIKHERGISMLGNLSISSNLVHSMVAEQLNSSSWRHKIIACKILPTLRGDINKDITNKLSDLMWNDWQVDVRRAAAQCLGKTGHGRDVHDELRVKLLEGDERTKLDALNKIGQLGIMTAKLLPAFLQCFTDQYIAIRSEACITSGNLIIKDEEVIAKLIHLATFDTIWKIKALAFQALGKIGVVTEQIVDCLLWAVRYEENGGVRAEACHTLKVLRVRTEEVADVLQDRFLVEGNALVRDELASTLKMFNISASEDMDMVAQIKKEVKKLCTRNIIASQITLNERDADHRENLTRMIYESEKDMKSPRKPSQVKFKVKPKRRKTVQIDEYVPVKVKTQHSHMSKSWYKISYLRNRRECPFVLNIFDTEHEVPLQPVMERIRSLSRAGSHKSEPRTGAESPEPVRDGAVFTPSAEEELEEILGRVDEESEGTSPASTPYTKSRPTTASSRENETEGDEEEEEGTEKRSSKTPLKSSEDDGRPSTWGSRSQGVKSEDDLEGEISKVTLEPERPASTVKFASHLEVNAIPSRSRSSLGPSRLSLMDEQTGKPSRSGTMMTGTTGEGMVFGRDAVVEREKISEKARNTFAVMDAWYDDMVQDLIDLDNAFELGLTSGSRQDFEEKIRNVRVIKTPPATKGERPKVELAVKTSVGSADKKDLPDKGTIMSEALEQDKEQDSKEEMAGRIELTAGDADKSTKKDIEIIVSEENRKS